MRIGTVEIYGQLIGKTAKTVSVLGETDEDEDGCNGTQVVITIDDGEYVFGHIPDCCAYASVMQVDGELDDLVGEPFAMAEIVEHKRNEGHGDEGETWSFLKLATIKGSVTVHWKGVSNGYYSESIGFGKKVKEGKSYTVIQWEDPTEKIKGKGVV